MKDQQQIKELRKFGLIVGGVFLLIGLWPILWQDGAIRFWAVALGVMLSVLGGIAPGLLQPVHKGWMFVGHIMGWINTRIILGVFFYAVLTPMGLVTRLIGKDFLHMRVKEKVDTYRIVRTPREGTHFRHQF